MWIIKYSFQSHDSCAREREKKRKSVRLQWINMVGIWDLDFGGFGSTYFTPNSFRAHYLWSTYITLCWLSAFNLLLMCDANNDAYQIRTDWVNRRKLSETNSHIQRKKNVVPSQYCTLHFFANFLLLFIVNSLERAHAALAMNETLFH